MMKEVPSVEEIMGRVQRILANEPSPPYVPKLYCAGVSPRAVSLSSIVSCLLSTYLVLCSNLYSCCQCRRIWHALFCIHHSQKRMIQPTKKWRILHEDEVMSSPPQDDEVVQSPQEDEGASSPRPDRIATRKRKSNVLASGDNKKNEEQQQHE